MRDDRIHYTLVGAFVLAVGVGLLIAAAAVTGRTGATDHYFAVFENVMGLTPGTQVFFEGYPIGQIKEIRSWRGENRQRFRVDVSVQKAWVIPIDSVAEITAPGLLAAFALEIHGGRSPQRIEVGGEIPAVAVPNIYALMSSVATDVGDLAAKNLKPLLESLGQRTPEIARNLEEFTARLNAISARFESLLSEENAGAVNRILVNLGSATGRIENLTLQLSETRTLLHEVLARVNHALADERVDLDRAVLDLQHTLATMATHVDAIAQNIEGTSRNMNEFSRRIRDNPAVLLDEDPPAEEN